MPQLISHKGQSTIIGSYELLGILGRGSQGSVHKARHMSTGELVAMKVVRDGILASPKDRLRFDDEHNALRTLNHASIPRVLDYGEPDGYQFIAIEYVEGVHLDEWIAFKSPLEKVPDLSCRIRIFAELCGAVEHAHERGIIHRDIKPQNVKVQADDTPVLLDFGLSKIDFKPNNVETVPGGFVGSLIYAAPEQVNGKSATVQSDVYSLGVLLYTLLTDFHPFSGCTNERIERFWRYGEPGIRASKRNPSLPTGFDRVLSSAMNHNPSRRYASAGDLASDCLRCFQEEGVHAKRDPIATRLRNYVRPIRSQLTIAGACLFALASLAWGITFAGSAPRAGNQMMREVRLAEVGPANEYQEAVSKCQHAFANEVNASHTISEAGIAITSLEQLADSIQRYTENEPNGTVSIDADLAISLSKSIRSSFEPHFRIYNERESQLLREIMNEMVAWESLGTEELEPHSTEAEREWRLDPQFQAIQNSVPNFLPTISRTVRLKRRWRELAPN